MSDETTLGSESGRGYKALALPLVLLGGALAMAAFLAWIQFVVIFMFLILGFVVNVFFNFFFVISHLGFS